MDLFWRIFPFRQMAGSISSIHSLTQPPTEAESKAAVAIQSAFKGYKVRKEIKEIQTFYRQVSNSEDQIASNRIRPGDLRTNKTRQVIELLFSRSILIFRDEKMNNFKQGLLVLDGRSIFKNP